MTVVRKIYGSLYVTSASFYYRVLGENNVSVRERKYLSDQRKWYPANSSKILRLEDVCR